MIICNSTRTGYNFVGWYTDGTTNSIYLSAPADFGPGAPTSWTATYEENYIDKYKWSWTSGTSAQITQNVGGVSVTWSGTYNQASKEHDKQTCNDKPGTDYIEFTGLSMITQNPATLPDGYSCTPTWTNNQNRLLTWGDATCGDAIVDGVKWWYGTGTCAGPEIDPQVVQHTEAPTFSGTYYGIASFPSGTTDGNITFAGSALSPTTFTFAQNGAGPHTVSGTFTLPVGSQATIVVSGTANANGILMVINARPGTGGTSNSAWTTTSGGCANGPAAGWVPC